MSIFPDHDSEVLEEVETVVTDQEERELIVYNDDYNTFDHVIDTLIKICGHEPLQAEQCTWIIHYKGKCTVKLGSYEFLKPMREGICDRGISAEIL